MADNQRKLRTCASKDSRLSEDDCMMLLDAACDSAGTPQHHLLSSAGCHVRDSETLQHRRDVAVTHLITFMRAHDETACRVLGTPAAAMQLLKVLLDGHAAGSEVAADCAADASLPRSQLGELLACILDAGHELSWSASDLQEVGLLLVEAVAASGMSSLEAPCQPTLAHPAPNTDTSSSRHAQSQSVYLAAVECLAILMARAPEQVAAKLCGSIADAALRSNQHMKLLGRCLCMQTSLAVAILEAHVAAQLMDAALKAFDTASTASTESSQDYVHSFDGADGPPNDAELKVWLVCQLCLAAGRQAAGALKVRRNMGRLVELLRKMLVSRQLIHRRLARAAIAVVGAAKDYPPPQYQASRNNAAGKTSNDSPFQIAASTDFADLASQILQLAVPQSVAVLVYAALLRSHVIMARDSGSAGHVWQHSRLQITSLVQEICQLGLQVCGDAAKERSYLLAGGIKVVAKWLLAAPDIHMAETGLNGHDADCEEMFKATWATASCLVKLGFANRQFQAAIEEMPGLLAGLAVWFSQQHASLLDEVHELKEAGIAVIDWKLLQQAIRLGCIQSGTCQAPTQQTQAQTQSQQPQQLSNLAVQSQGTMGKHADLPVQRQPKGQHLASGNALIERQPCSHKQDEASWRLPLITCPSLYSTGTASSSQQLTQSEKANGGSLNMQQVPVMKTHTRQLHPQQATIPAAAHHQHLCRRDLQQNLQQGARGGTTSRTPPAVNTNSCSGQAAPSSVQQVLLLLSSNDSQGLQMLARAAKASPRACKRLAQHSQVWDALVRYWEAAPSKEAVLETFQALTAALTDDNSWQLLRDSGLLRSWLSCVEQSGKQSAHLCIRLLAVLLRVLLLQPKLAEQLVCRRRFLLKLVDLCCSQHAGAVASQLLNALLGGGKAQQCTQQLDTSQWVEKVTLAVCAETAPNAAVPDLLQLLSKLCLKRSLVVRVSAVDWIASHLMVFLEDCRAAVRRSAASALLQLVNKNTEARDIALELVRQAGAMAALVMKLADNDSLVVRLSSKCLCAVATKHPSKSAQNICGLITSHNTPRGPWKVPEQVLWQLLLHIEADTPAREAATCVIRVLVCSTNDEALHWQLQQCRVHDKLTECLIPPAQQAQDSVRRHAALALLGMCQSQMLQETVTRLDDAAKLRSTILSSMAEAALSQLPPLSFVNKLRQEWNEYQVAETAVLSRQQQSTAHPDN